MPNFDYLGKHYYFITICAYRHRSMFGAVMDGVVVPSQLGRIVTEEWNLTFELRPYLAKDDMVVMPNHMHGLLSIEDNVGTAGEGIGNQFGRLHDRSIPKVIAAFKVAVTRRAQRAGLLPADGLWQRNYYEHLVRSEQSLQAIREYILNNPAKWGEDRYYQGGAEAGARQVARG